MVIGPFAADTPWRSLVTLAPPIARRDVGERTILARAAVRNGENRWATLVERASCAVAPALAHEG